MKRKMFKNLSALVVSVTLLVGGTMTVCAAAGSGCAHDYTIKEYESVTINSLGYDTHEIIIETEYYCLDCGAYFTEVVTKTDPHNYVGGVCSECGQNE